MEPANELRARPNDFTIEGVLSAIRDWVVGSVSTVNEDLEGASMRRDAGSARDLAFRIPAVEHAKITGEKLYSFLVDRFPGGTVHKIGNLALMLEPGRPGIEHKLFVSYSLTAHDRVLVTVDALSRV